MATVKEIPLEDNFGAGDGLPDSTPDPVEDSPEALAAKAKAFDDRNAGETPPELDAPGVDPKPADGFDKFYNKEDGKYDWENHAKEQKWQLEQQKKPPAPPKKIEIKEPEKGKEIDPTNQMQEVFDKMAEDFEANGELSTENRSTLSKMGFPDSVVNTYLNGLQATNELVSTKSVELMGGQEKLDAVMDWASNNLNVAQREAINNDLANPDMLETTLLGLQARYNNAIGTQGETPLIDGSAVGEQSVEGYETPYLHRRDIAKQEYKDSAKFRHKVMQKMAASTWYQKEAGLI